MTAFNPKIKIQLKDPDGVYDSLVGLPEELKEEIVSKYFEHWEYLTLEYDTETKTLIPLTCN